MTAEEAINELVDYGDGRDPYPAIKTEAARVLRDELQRLRDIESDYDRIQWEEYGNGPEPDQKTLVGWDEANRRLAERYAR